MLEWVVAAAAVVVGWCVLAVVVGLVLGRVVRLRDRQVPGRGRPARDVPVARPAPAADHDRERG